MYRATRPLTIAWWVAIALGGLLSTAVVLATSRIVASVASGQPIDRPIAALTASFVALAALTSVNASLSAGLGNRTADWLHTGLLAACLSPTTIDHLEDPDLANRLAAARDFDLGMGGAPLAVAMPRIATRLTAVVTGLAMTVVLAAYRWPAALLLAGAWAGTNWLLRRSTLWDERLSDPVALRQRRARYDYELMFSPGAAKEVRLFGLGAWLAGRFADERRRVLDESQQARRLRRAPLVAAVVAVAGANAVVFGLLARDAAAGRLGLGAAVLYLQAVVGVAVLAYADDSFLRAAAQPIPLVLGLIAELDQAATRGATGAHDATGLPAAGITFDDVSFAYDDGPPVLDHLSLTIPAGSSLAVVGLNGAGKTTLVKLLCRLHEPRSGSISVDGLPLTELDVASWRRQLAAVFQDFVRYEWSLRDNVAPSGDATHVASALLAARADHPPDPDTVLSPGYEGGVDLSGGQWQRVALARALNRVLDGATVVILDEPTAHLDARTEEQSFNQLLDATRHCTTILISHRFSTVRRAERICVLEGGRIVELGSHEELLAKRGTYHTLFELQASRYDEHADEDLDTHAR